MTNLVDQQLGNYRLIRSIGQGGFADVYLGEHLHLGTYAAIKVLRIHLGGSSVEQFRTEARTIAALVHPHIVRVLDFGVEHEIPFLVMDYAPGGSLRQRCPRGMILATSAIIAYTKQIASALQYAHDQQFIHRDVKPENMLLAENDTLLLSDFGLVQVAHDSSSRSVQETAGTAAYIAPEQIEGKPRLASDQYALAAIVYEWLGGAPLFQGSPIEVYGQHLHAAPSSLRAKIPTISAAVENVVFTALAKDPHQRFARIQDFGVALEQAFQVGGSRPFSPGLNLPFKPAVSQPLHLAGQGPTPSLSLSAYKNTQFNQPSSYMDPTRSDIRPLPPVMENRSQSFATVPYSPQFLHTPHTSSSSAIPANLLGNPASTLNMKVRQRVNYYGVNNVLLVALTLVVLLGSMVWFFSFALPRLQGNTVAKTVPVTHKNTPVIKPTAAPLPTATPPPPAGITFSVAPSVVSWGPNRLDVFGHGSDGAIYHNYWDGSWHTFESLGGNFTYGAAVASWGVGRLDVLAVGTDGAIYHNYWDGSWHGWADRLGGVFTATPAMASSGLNHLDVFARGTDNAMWHTYWDGSWHAFDSLGGVFTSGPGATSWGGGRVDVFGVGTDGAIYHNYWDGSWHGWGDRIAGTFASAPAVSSWGVNHIDLFYVGTDNAIWHIYWDGSIWHTPETLGGTFTSAPASASWGAGRLDVFTIGADSAIYHNNWDGNWHGWVDRIN